ncbi:interferon regulatory factor 7 [Rhinoderma darwinii]|uniref:interferon regulatory factor 7 n=1 Tax=Rhinoderma darwinii TaxID=43563 RepID=UPI003F680151
MPRRESRERFGPWLLRQINSNIFDGVRWLDESRTLFRLPWKHLNMKNADEKDYGIFKAWAICSEKYNPQCEDPPTWKTNFRCALNQVPYCDRKMFSEFKDYSSDQRDPHKIYSFNGVHHDLPASNPNVATFHENPSNPEEQNLLNELNDEDYTLRISPDCVRVAPFTRPEESELIEELMRNVLLDSAENSIQQVLNLSQDEYLQGDQHVDQVFRQSTHEQWANSQLMESCVVNGHERALHEEPSIHIPVFHEHCTQYQMCDIYQNRYPQNVSVNQVFQQMSALPPYLHPQPIPNGLVPVLHEPRAIQQNGYQQKSAHDIIYGFQQDVSGLDQLINPSPMRQDPPLANGPGQSFVQRTQDNLLNQQSGHEIAYKSVNNGCPQAEPRVDQGINSSPNYSYHTTSEDCARSSPVGHNLPLVNGSGQACAQESRATLQDQQRRFPPVTSWEVTIYYRGREVLKKNVSKKFFITRDVDDAQMEQTDIVQFPSTDQLVDHLQIKYTNDILSCVGKGLLLEVKPEDNYKVYATRMGKSRVYWSLSESLETKETASEAKLLVRDVPTEIFGFSQFWEELKAYKSHRSSSPDYTIYMTFGQSLFEPVMKKLVLVKLVPNLCSFFHQVAQQNGASSLHSELVSLQISNGSSFNSSDLNVPCLMDLEFQDLL